ncbi:hypothetical protein B0H14DRAFT_2646734 [Mycena olivaceomarginata]|nr:hypothetical protein B0H14DRAFT_2646734 [Mycena olivaceomarginata]
MERIIEHPSRKFVGFNSIVEQTATRRNAGCPYSSSSGIESSSESSESPCSASNSSTDQCLNVRVDGCTEDGKPETHGGLKDLATCFIIELGVARLPDQGHEKSIRKAKEEKEGKRNPPTISLLQCAIDHNNRAALAAKREKMQADYVARKRAAFFGNKGKDAVLGTSGGSSSRTVATPSTSVAEPPATPSTQAGDSTLAVDDNGASGSGMHID